MTDASTFQRIPLAGILTASALLMLGCGSSSTAASSSPDGSTAGASSDGGATSVLDTGTTGFEEASPPAGDGASEDI